MSDSAVEIARKAREASARVATLPTQTRNAVLTDLAASLQSNADSIAAANAGDLAAARTAGLRRACTAVRCRRSTISVAVPPGAKSPCQ